jgi:iron complex transport system substrate-binding protein
MRPPRRVVSLVASNTEIVCALGLGDRLVGLDDFSDWPPAVQHLPRVGRDLDIDVERVARLEPDLVLASLSVPGMERNVERLAASGVPHAVIEPRGLDGVFENVRQVAALLGEPERGERLAAELRERMAAIVAAVAPAAARHRPRVYWEWWPRPPITPGGRSWMTRLIEKAGGRNIYADLDRESAPVTLEGVASREPEVVVLCVCGAKKLPDVASVYARAGWEQMPAVRNRRAYALLEPWYGRPGPRLVDGLAELAQVLHPGVETHAHV